MRRIGKRWLGMWLVAAIAASGHGCATITGVTRAQDARKAASHVQVGSDHRERAQRARAARVPRRRAARPEERTGALRARRRLPRARKARRLGAARAPRTPAVSGLPRRAALPHRAAAGPEALCGSDPRVRPPDQRPHLRGALARAHRPRAGRSTSSAAARRRAIRFAGGRDRKNYWPATLALAIFEGDAGRRVEAIRLYKDIIAQAPGPSVESEVNYRIAELYVSLGKRKEAVGHLTTSVARAPESHWAKKSQAYLKRLH